eukprot:scaffold19217_cov117-Isochrysis_galbana.AAC.5
MIVLAHRSSRYTSSTCKARIGHGLPHALFISAQQTRPNERTTLRAETPYRCTANCGDITTSRRSSAKMKSR